MQGGTGKLESQESLEKEVLEMPSPESNLLFEILLCQAFVECPTPHLCSYTSFLVRPRMEEKDSSFRKMSLQT